MPLSAVAGILSPDGGLRTVVTQRWRMQSHVKRGERLFVVPGLLVEEPVPWDQIPTVIQSVHQHVVSSLAPKNDCGECRQCCITLYIASGGGWVGPPKPSHTACEHCDAAVGCMVYFNRPKPCRTFSCLWLRSQGSNWQMGPELRPDRCGVIFTAPEPGDPDNLVYVHPSAHAPEAVTQEPVTGAIAEFQERGHQTRLVTHYHGEKP